MGTDRSTLWVKLAKLGISDPMIQWLKYLYDRIRYIVRLDGQYTPELRSLLGILLGIQTHRIEHTDDVMTVSSIWPIQYRCVYLTVKNLCYWIEQHGTLCEINLLNLEHAKKESLWLMTCGSFFRGSITSQKVNKLSLSLQCAAELEIHLSNLMQLLGSVHHVREMALHCGADTFCCWLHKSFPTGNTDFLYCVASLASIVNHWTNTSIAQQNNFLTGVAPCM
jgi:hypothetical protein